MSTLHLVRTSAFVSNNLSLALKTALVNDAIVLLDDGCYSLKHALILHTEHNNNPINFYAINEHCQARAIEYNSSVSAISMAQLVELTFSYNTVMTWQ